MSDATLLEFSRVNDATAATTRKLQKQAILAAYFAALVDDEDLRRATRYAGGCAFPATDETNLSVGGALVSDAVLSILNVEPGEFWQTVTASGEIGEALSQLWSRYAPSCSNGVIGRTAGLTLSDLARSFDEIAVTGNQESKRSILRDLFMRCSDSREATYLAKVIFGDLRTGVQEGVLLAAIAHAFNRPIDAVRRAQLLNGDVGEVAVLARHDRLTDATFALFHPIQFMLATPQESSADAAATMAGRTFWAEDKLDGIRAQVHKSGGRIAIYTRTMDRIDASFPEVVSALSQLPGEFLLDGELVPYRDGCVLPFAHIQRRLGRKSLSGDIIRDNPCVFIAFDLLLRDGRLLMDEPLRVRRASLKTLGSSLSPGGPGEGPGEGRLILTNLTEVSTAEEIDSAFEHARGCRNEGLVLKDPESPYSPGRRGQMWLKLKTHLPTLDCVVTAAEYGHGKRRNSLSDYTFAVWDRDPTETGAALVNVGKAYSGVTDEEIARLTELFHSISLERRGHVYRVKPEIVMEIAFDQIQVSRRHASGFALRFPRIKRIRWDKKPFDADRLTRVREIYDSTHNFARGGELSATPPSSAKPSRRRKPDLQQMTLFDP